MSAVTSVQEYKSKSYRANQTVQGGEECSTYIERGIYI